MTGKTDSLRLGPLLQIGGVMAICALLAGSDGLRLWRAYSESATSSMVVGALAFVATVGLSAAILLRWGRMSVLARRVAVCLPPIWLLFMLWAFVATHKMRGLRHYYQAVGELDSPWLIAVVTYQTMVWVITLAALPVAMWTWWRRR